MRLCVRDTALQAETVPAALPRYERPCKQVVHVRPQYGRQRSCAGKVKAGDVRPDAIERCGQRAKVAVFHRVGRIADLCIVQAVQAGVRHGHPLQVVAHGAGNLVANQPLKRLQRRMLAVCKTIGTLAEDGHCTGHARWADDAEGTPCRQRQDAIVLQKYGAACSQAACHRYVPALHCFAYRRGAARGLEHAKAVERVQIGAHGSGQRPLPSRLRRPRKAARAACPHIACPRAFPARTPPLSAKGEYRQHQSETTMPVKAPLLARQAVDDVRHAGTSTRH